MWSQSVVKIFGAFGVSADIGQNIVVLDSVLMYHSMLRLLQITRSDTGACLLINRLRKKLHVCVGGGLGRYL